MVYLGLALKLISIKQLSKLAAVAVHHREVKRAEVLVEGRIGEVLTEVKYS